MRLRGHLHDQARAIAGSSTTQLTQSLLQVCVAQERRTQARLQHDVGVAREELAKAGKATFADKTAWKAVNQFSQESRTVELPKLLLGGKWLGRNGDAGAPSPVVDAVKHYELDSCTIFQRMNEAGDMLRVCTTVTDARGNRAVATYIPLVHPDGSRDAVLSNVLQGESYSGRSCVVGQWYDTYYEPIWDSDKKQKVVGMWFIGVPQDETMRYVYDAFRATKASKSGYVFVLQGSGADRGKYFLSKDGARDGENVWEEKDAAGRPAVQSLIAAALNAVPGTPSAAPGGWNNPDDKAGRTSITAVTYYPAWDWVIGVCAYEDDYSDLTRGATDALTTGSGLAVACAVGVALLGGVLAAFCRAGPRASHPHRREVVGQGCAGRHFRRCFRSPLPPERRDRAAGARSPGDDAGVARDDGPNHRRRAATDELVRLRFPACSTQITVGAKDATAQATAVAAAAEQLSTSMDVMSASGGQMSDNVKVVTAAIAQMDASIGEIAASAERAAAVAEHAATMTAESNRKVAELGTAAHEIGAFVNVIQDIADQTNLLALNATIEAARAGDAGKGFAVVATEVKELAKQSAGATDDIRRRVELIRGTIERTVQSIAGIGEVIQDVSGVSRTIASTVEEQSATTKEIARNISQAASAVQAVAEGIAQSAVASREITQNIASVSTAVEQTAGGAITTQKAVGDLIVTAGELQNIVSRFRANRGSFDAEAIKLAHRKWRVRLAGMIAGTEVVKADEMKNHTECAFGKWYSIEGRKLFDAIPLFHNLGEEHEKVHEMAKKIFHSHQEGRVKEAAQMLEEFAPLTDGLCGMVDELHQQSCGVSQAV